MGRLRATYLLNVRPCSWISKYLNKAPFHREISRYKGKKSEKQDGNPAGSVQDWLNKMQSKKECSPVKNNERMRGEVNRRNSI